MKSGPFGQLKNLQFRLLLHKFNGISYPIVINELAEVHPGSGEIAVFMSAFVGALIAFLWYNSYPAQVFMGDTGSLMIGGVIGVGAVLIRKELLHRAIRTWHPSRAVSASRRLSTP